jgi:hypothetical protein
MYLRVLSVVKVIGGIRGVPEYNPKEGTVADTKEITKLIQGFIDQQQAALRQLNANLLALFQPPAAVAPAVDVAAQLREATRLSACGHDATVLRHRFVAYLNNHGRVGQWLSVYDMCTETKAWQEFGKASTKLVLTTMEEFAELKDLPENYASFTASTCTTASAIRLRAADTNDVY